jgi:hypothetical protein
LLSLPLSEVNDPLTLRRREEWEGGSEHPLWGVAQSAVQYLRHHRSRRSVWRRDGAVAREGHLELLSEEVRVRGPSDKRCVGDKRRSREWGSKGLWDGHEEF